MDFDAIDRLTESEAKAHLRALLEGVTQPAFGVLPQRELDLILFKLMRDMGVIDPDASLYELMSDLKITRAKARNLVFDLEIRDAQAARGLDARARAALAKPRGFVMDGAYLAFGIENPVVQAHIKDKVTSLGHLTDASFDATIVKIKPQAMGALVEALMEEKDRDAFREGMIAAGFDKDDSLQTLIREGLVFIGKKTIGDTATDIGAGYLEDLADFITPYARKAQDKIAAVLKQVKAGRDGAEAKGETGEGPRARAL